MEINQNLLADVQCGIEDMTAAGGSNVGDAAQLAAEMLEAAAELLQAIAHKTNDGNLQAYVVEQINRIQGDLTTRLDSLREYDSDDEQPIGVAEWVYDLTNHGVEYADYWQGFGCSLSEYDHIATGVGDTLQDAIEDAMFQAAVMGAPQDMLDAAETDAKSQFTSAQLAETAVDGPMGEDEEPEDGEDLDDYSRPDWRYSIRWKLA